MYSPFASKSGAVPHSGVGLVSQSIYRFALHEHCSFPVFHHPGRSGASFLRGKPAWPQANLRQDGNRPALKIAQLEYPVGHIDWSRFAEKTVALLEAAKA